MSLTKSLEIFWEHQSKWSQDTFGLDTERGPIGPLKHLKKEVDEALQDPFDLMEYVDCLFLVFDAARRAGYVYQELENAAWTKLGINQKRAWAKVDSDEPSEHIK